MIRADKFKRYGKTKHPQPNLINSNNMIDARYSHCPALSPCPKHLMFSGLLSDNERTNGYSVSDSNCKFKINKQLKAK